MRPCMTITICYSTNKEKQQQYEKILKVCIRIMRKPVVNSYLISIQHLIKQQKSDC